MTRDSRARLEDVVRAGDTLVCQPALTSRTPPASGQFILPPSTPLTGTGGFQAQGGTVCIPSDITTLSLTGVSYTAGPFTAPGHGTVTFKLQAVHHTGRLMTGGNRVVVNGGPVDLHFRVIKKAQDLKVPPNEDPATEYEGKANLRFDAKRTVHAGG